MPFSQGVLKVANPSENMKNVPETAPHHHVFLRYELHLFLQMTLLLYRRWAMGGGDCIFKLNKSAATVKFILWLKNVVGDLFSRPVRLVVAVDGLVRVWWSWLC